MILNDFEKTIRSWVVGQVANQDKKKKKKTFNIRKFSCQTCFQHPPLRANKQSMLRFSAVTFLRTYKSHVADHYSRPFNSLFAQCKTLKKKERKKWWSESAVTKEKRKCARESPGPSWWEVEFLNAWVSSSARQGVAGDEEVVRGKREKNDISHGAAAPHLRFSAVPQEDAPFAVPYDHLEWGGGEKGGGGKRERSLFIENAF